jgi:inner membrane protein YhjD
VDRIKALIAKAQLVVEKARARYALVDIVVGTFKRFSQDDGGSYAAALTYYIFFSIFPLLLVSVSILGYLTLHDQALQQRIFASGVKTIPLLSQALSPSGVKTIQDSRGTLAGVGIVLALYSGSGAIVALGHALNKVRHVADEPNFLMKRLYSLLWLAVLGLAAIASLGITAAVAAAGPLAALLGIVGGVAVNVGIFAIAFKVLPGDEQSWREVLPGACVAAVAFEILKFVGALYLEHGSKTRNETFGALAGAATLLVACYLISQVTLLSAEVNAVLAERRTSRRPAVADKEA